MIYLNLVNELICALCWGITIRLILIRHLNSETKVARFNTFAFVLMVVNLVVVLPIFAFLLKNLPSIIHEHSILVSKNRGIKPLTI